LLRNRDFLLFLTGQVVSNSGTWLQNVAQGILILELTGRTAMVGLANAALFAPVLFLAPLGGRMADAIDRRRLLVATQASAMAATAVLAVLAHVGRASVGAVLTVAVVIGIQNAFFTPTMQASLPALAGQPALARAVGLNSATYNLARLIGPLVSSAAIAAVGFALAFALNSLSYLILVVVLLSMRLPASLRPTSRVLVREGAAYALGTRRVLLMLLGVVVVSMAMDPSLTVAPALVIETYGEGRAAVGVFMASFGLGAVLAPFILGRALRISPDADLRAAAPWMVLFAAGLAGVALSPNLWLAAVALFISGVGFLAAHATLTAGVLTAIPEKLRGRIMGLWTVCFLGSRPIAALLDGAIADLTDPRIPFVVMAGLLAVTALLGGLPGSRAIPRSGS
jgi:MFS family permease